MSGFFRNDIVTIRPSPLARVMIDLSARECLSGANLSHFLSWSNHAVHFRYLGWLHSDVARADCGRRHLCRTACQDCFRQYRDPWSDADNIAGAFVRRVSRAVITCFWEIAGRFAYGSIPRLSVARSSGDSAHYTHAEYPPAGQDCQFLKKVVVSARGFEPPAPGFIPLRLSPPHSL